MRLFIGIIVFFSFLGACSSDEVANYEVGSDFLDSNLLVRVIDTFTINTGTFKLEEVITSSTGRVLVGHINDSNLGDLTSQSYFQLNRDFSIDIDNNAVFDSIGFVMNYDQYYKGDTLQPQTYKLHWITQTFEPEDDQDGFYNTDALTKDETLGVNGDGVIGQLTFTPRPNRASDSLYIPIDNSIGLEIFNAIQDNEIITSDDFLSEYRGLTIIPDNTNSHVLGFNTSTTEYVTGNTSLRIYYTLEDGDIDTDDDAPDYIDFVITDITKLFNRITTEFENASNPAFIVTPQEPNILNDSELTINSEDTDNLSYIQGGTGLSTSFNMPSIKKLNQLSDFGSSLGAELTFKPTQSSYNTVDDLQDSLLVYIIDDRNRIQTQLTDIEGNISYAILNEEIGVFDNYFYSIDASNFVDIILSSEEDLDYRIMVQFNNYRQAVENTVIDAGNSNDSKLKLSVNYLNY